MQTGSAAQEHPHLALAVSYGPRFVTTTSEPVAEDSQEVIPAVEGGHADHTLPQTGSKEHALGLLGLFTLTASSLIFWRKKREDA